MSFRSMRNFGGGGGRRNRPENVITVPSYTEKYDPDRREKFVDYLVCLKLKDGTIVEHEKELEEFIEFHKEWKRTFPKVKVRGTPKKPGFFDPKENYLRRRFELEVYLNDCSRIDCLRFLLAVFLGVTDTELRDALPPKTVKSITGGSLFKRMSQLGKSSFKAFVSNRGLQSMRNFGGGGGARRRPPAQIPPSAPPAPNNAGYPRGGEPFNAAAQAPPRPLPRNNTPPPQFTPPQQTPPPPFIPPQQQQQQQQLQYQQPIGYRMNAQPITQNDNYQQYQQQQPIIQNDNYQAPPLLPIRRQDSNPQRVQEPSKNFKLEEVQDERIQQYKNMINGSGSAPPSPAGGRIPRRSRMASPNFTTTPIGMGPITRQAMPVYQRPDPNNPPRTPIQFKQPQQVY